MEREQKQKESYTEPVLVSHESLRDVTGVKYREKINDKAGENY